MGFRYQMAGGTATFFASFGWCSLFITHFFLSRDSNRTTRLNSMRVHLRSVEPTSTSLFNADQNLLLPTTSKCVCSMQHPGRKISRTTLSTQFVHAPNDAMRPRTQEHLRNSTGTEGKERRVSGFAGRHCRCRTVSFQILLPFPPTRGQRVLFSEHISRHRGSLVERSDTPEGEWVYSVVGVVSPLWARSSSGWPSQQAV